MKKKFTKLLGVALTVAMLATLVLAAVPVSAGELSWTSQTLPSATNRIVVAGAAVADFAVGMDNTTVWAVDGALNVYKSSDGGAKWTSITTLPAAAGTTATPDATITSVAISPDDVGVVALIADANEVYVTTNGGSTWSALQVPVDPSATPAGAAALNLYDIAISPLVSGARNVAVAGDEALATATAGNVWYFNLGSSVPAWKETNSKTGFDLTSDEGAFAVAFSPAYTSDKVMLAVTGPNGVVAGDTLVKLQMFSLNSYMWNASAAFSAAATVDTLVAADTVTRADMAMPSTYLGADPDTRKVFVTVASSGGNLGGLFRVTTSSKELTTSPLNMWSVAYNTDGDKLVAGKATAGVYRCADPMATTPSLYSNSTYKGPGGLTNTVVSWIGDTVVAGTSGNESAFAKSTDSGKTFNDISLIDTALTVKTDIAPSADGSKYYVVTDDTADVSVWLYDGSWQRVLSVQGDTGFIVRIAPENADAVYVADTSAGGTTAGTAIYYSGDAGKVKWLYRVATAAVQDLAVESAEVVYLLRANGNVYKSTNSGFIWGTAKNTSLGAGYMIRSISENNLIVGGTAANSTVSYSTDSASTWTMITPTITAGNVSVTAEGLADGDNIYVGTSAVNDKVSRWTIGTNSTSWSSLSATPTATIGSGLFNKDIDVDAAADLCGVTGIELVNGALYVMADDGEVGPLVRDSMVARNLSPSITYTTVQVTWSTINSSGEGFNAAPQALRTSAGSTKIWAIDTLGATVDVFTDTLSEAGPTLSGPVDGFKVAMNKTTGRAYGVTFVWPRISKATVYDLDVAFDSGFTQKLLSENNWGSTSSTVSTTIGPFSAAPVSGATPNWEPGTTYYWRVRADGPARSPWSETRSFTVDELVLFQPALQAPNPGAQDVILQPAFAWSAVEGATQYQFQMADNDDYLGPTALKKTLYSNVWQSEVKLNYSTTYFWRVKAQSLEGVSVVAESPWVVNIFTTVAEPAPVLAPAPPVTVTPAPPAPVINLPAPVVNIPPQPEPITPAYVWAIIGIGAILVIVVIVLIVRTRRPV